MTISLAWITGGGTGIGLACARQMGKAGATVVISGRRQEELNKAVAALKAEGIAAHAIALDVSDATAVAQAGASIARDHGSVDTLVMSAGTNVPNRHWDNLTAEGFAKVMAINMNGVVHCITAVLPGMRKARKGSIVVVSSWGGWRYLPFVGAAYGAAKTGLSPLVESLNDQEGRNGIRATLVCPGEVATPILSTRPVPPPQADLDRMLKAEDVAEAITYAVSAPAHVCLNEIVISPTWNRIYIGADDLKRKG